VSTKFFRIVSLIKLKDRVQTHNCARVVSQRTASAARIHALFAKIAQAWRNPIQSAVTFGKPCRHNPARTTEANRTRDLRVSTSVGARIASLSASFSAFYCDFCGSDFFEMIQAKVKPFYRKGRQHGRTRTPAQVRPRGQCDSLLVHALKIFLT
jgi:hypothetical protein